MVTIFLLDFLKKKIPFIISNTYTQKYVWKSIFDLNKFYNYIFFKKPPRYKEQCESKNIDFIIKKGKSVKFVLISQIDV